MEPKINYIDNLIPGRTDWKLRVRLNRLWTMPDHKSNLEIGTIEMILIDEKFGKIQATIPRQWIPKFIDALQEGQSYLLENLNVGTNDRIFPKTSHKYKLNFMGITKVTQKAVDKIPVHVFDFLDFPSILQTKKTDIFIDIIGHVVEKDNIRDKMINGKRTPLLDLVFEDLADHRVRCALWADYALQMQDALESTTNGTPIVVVIQMCRLNKFKDVGNVSSAWYGTKLFINADIPAIHDYRSRLVSDDLPVTSSVTQISRNAAISIADELLSTTRMTISELIEATQPTVGSELVNAVEFDMSEGWAFNSCNTCFRSANKVGTVFSCKHCDKLVTATPRYKLNVVVIDETGSTTFTLFNGLVSMIVGRSAVDLITSYEQRGTLGDQPIEFETMLGIKFLFKVEVTKGNIEKRYSTYTARKYSSESAVIQRFVNKHGLNACTEEEEAEITHTLDKLGSHTPLINLGDSSSTDKTEDYLTEFDVTPTPSSKKLGKRPIDDYEGIDLNNMDFSPESFKKLNRGSIKIEPKE